MLMDIQVDYDRTALAVNDVIEVGVRVELNKGAARQAIVDLGIPPGFEVLTEDLAGINLFSGYDRILVPSEEAYAANTLAVNEHLLIPAGYPQTREKIEALGMPVIELDVSEVAKMDGGLTCLSLRFT